MLNLGKETMLLGKWRVSRLGLRVIREFKDWVTDKLPDPMGLGEQYFKLLPPEEQLARLKQAEYQNDALRNFTMKGALAQEYLNTEEGAAKFAQLMLKKHHPNITEEDAFDIFQEAKADIENIIAEAEGKVPNDQAPAGPSPAGKAE